MKLLAPLCCDYYVYTLGGERITLIHAAILMAHKDAISIIAPFMNDPHEPTNPIRPLSTPIQTAQSRGFSDIVEILETFKGPRFY